MFTLRRRNNGKSLVIVSTDKDAPRSNSGLSKMADVTLSPPVRKNQAVKTSKGWTVLSKHVFDYAMWAPASAPKARIEYTMGRMAAYWMVAKLDAADAWKSIKFIPEGTRRVFNEFRTSIRKGGLEGAPAILDKRLEELKAEFKASVILKGTK